MKKPVQVFNFSVINKANDTIDIHIDGDVVDASTQAMIEAYFGDTVSVSYKSFRNEISKANAKTINVIINSPGGHVGDAMAIHDYLVDLRKNGTAVNTIGRGIVASSATLILLAGENPEMSANSWFMMHTVSGGIYGTVQQVENYAATMRKFNNSIRDLYASKSGLPVEEIDNLMEAETWLNATEAKDKGLISNVSGNESFSNAISEDQWNFNNKAILNSYNKFVKPVENNQFEDMKNFFKDLATNITNEVKNALKGFKPQDGTDNEAFINGLAAAVSKPFESLDIETPVNEAVTNATQALVTRLDEMEKVNNAMIKKNEELEQDILTLRGKSTIDNNNNNGGTKPVGSFV